MVRIEKYCNMLDITCKGVFLRFFKLFTYSHKVVPTWFILNETWNTTLFSIHYCVEMVRIENNSHIH